MKINSINILKKELSTLPAGDVIDICMKLVKYKKENKELLSYLLFDAINEAGYIKSIKAELDQQFAEINPGNLYIAKKSVRKILKNTNKYIKYSSYKQTQVELLMHFCLRLKESKISVRTSDSLSNLYLNQINKINSAIYTLHEDLQHDYHEEIAVLKLF